MPSVNINKPKARLLYAV
ncbi:hypothetical protein [Escherichia coli]